MPSALYPRLSHRPAPECAAKLRAQLRQLRSSRFACVAAAVALRLCLASAVALSAVRPPPALRCPAAAPARPLRPLSSLEVPLCNFQLRFPCCALLRGLVGFRPRPRLGKAWSCGRYPAATLCIARSGLASQAAFLLRGGQLAQCPPATPPFPLLCAVLASVARAPERWSHTRPNG